MNTKLLAAFIPSVILSASIVVAYIFLRTYKLSRKGRRSPLTRQLLRSPGESLRTQIEDITADILFFLMLIFVIPLLFYSIYLSEILSGKEGGLSIITLFTAAAIGFCMIKLWKMLKLRNLLFLGLDCELTVGQELNYLMLEGCRVYHDFPAEKFNIDHVVVGPRGVFAVETKGRAKPDKKMGREEAIVIYDGHTLNFPGWTETEPIVQARLQAEWLSKWLTSAVGEYISVQPVLSFPGWYVEQKEKDDLIFLYGKATFLAQPLNIEALSKPLIQRIS
ncbi:MAG: NERD domain-containing protein, partial [Nanoarchaeota archaeon]